MDSKQGSIVTINDKRYINFCSNDYIGLANNPVITKHAKDAIDRWGYGLSSVRFICGTQTIHLELEKKLANIFSKGDCILFNSCWDANTALFETILTNDSVIISDEMNHASIINGIRLTKCERYRYKHSDMEDLENILKQSLKREFGKTIISTDGVFSMDGDMAKLEEICNLAVKYNALIHVDDSHGNWVIGETGKGSLEICGVLDKVDIITTTFGKALGGACGGCIISSKRIIDNLRNNARPYLFSNSLIPVVTCTTIKCLDYVEKYPTLFKDLNHKTMYFRNKLRKYNLINNKDTHPIVPIILGDNETTDRLQNILLENGIFVKSFKYPVVPKDKSRIRIQINVNHTIEQIDKLLDLLKENVDGKEKVLVTGCCGQIGSELIVKLREKYGNKNVIGITKKSSPPDSILKGPFEFCDICDYDAYKNIIEKYNIKTVYNMAAILSVVGEKYPDLCHAVNINGLKNVLDIAVEYEQKVFVPSSIAVFGGKFQKIDTPQEEVTHPSTMYGITKVSGELLCHYYRDKKGLDVRGVRYPGIISWNTLPGGGTTDYAVDMILNSVKRESKYTCYLRPDTKLPMMFIDDAINGTIQLMDKDGDKLRSDYNLQSVSFTPRELENIIKKNIEKFTCVYEVDDKRQEIADSWMESVDDSVAKREWGWKTECGCISDFEKIIGDFISLTYIYMGQK